MERLFESSGIGLILVSPQGTFLDANATFCHKLGYSREELLHKPVAEVTHPDDLGMTTALFKAFVEVNHIRVFEKRYITRSGDTLWFKMRSEVVPTEDEAQLARIVMVEDITREKLDEINLELMAAITEASDDAIFRADIAGVIQFWGKGAERLYGYTAEEAIGQHANFVAAVQDDHTLLCVPERLARGEVVIDPDGISRHKDGHLLEISALIFPIRNKEGNIVAYAAVHRDISEMKQLQMEFRHSQRLETAGLLAGGIAHDFNNIITVIKGAGYLLADEFPTGSNAASHLQLIDRAAERASRLTRQLLAFSRKQKITPVILDPNELLKESVAMLKRTLGDDVSLVTRFNSSWFVREDVTQLEQVLLNLAVNARHAMPKGGTLTIETGDLVVDEGHKVEGAGKLRYTPVPLKPGSYVVLSVQDTGTGMKKETLERIFDPFFTTKPKGEGAGLGLSVVFGIVTQVGGGISVVTEPDKGTEFRIFLPKTEGKPHNAEKPVIPPSMNHSGRILVVEDDDNVRALTAALLKGAGYTVFEAANPQLVLNGEVESAVDLILSDVMMPEMSGPEFSAIWLQSHPHAKFLFMSGYFDSGTFDQKLSGKNLIQKPFKPAELLQMIAQMIEGG
jgi:PAS domain S-box-containing protein